ncbi:MAG: DUF3576 domain-containing protein [Pseudomonadota bacterium]
MKYRMLWVVLGGITLSACGGGGDFKEPESRTYALGVNGYLWRAALDTLGFMPMAQVDGGSGVILTDWYVNPDTPTERLKVTVYVLDRALRADSVTVNVFREVVQNNEWVSAPVRAGTAQKIEDAILHRARQIRIGVIDRG